MRRHSLLRLCAVTACAVLVVATPAAAATEPTCSPFKQLETQFMWNATATTSECKPFIAKTANVSQLRDIVWPCTSASCTARMAALAKALPDCVAPGKTTSLKTQVRAAVENCSNGSGSGNTTKVNAMAIRSRSSSGSDSGGGSSNVTKFSMLSCSTTETKTTTDEFLTLATGVECKPYAVVGSYIISVFAPCKSRCVTTKYDSLAASVPDCFLSNSEERRNKKQQLTNALLNCSRANTSTEAVMSLYISLETADRIDATKSGSSPYYSQPKSGAVARSDLKSTAGLVVAVAMAAVTIVQAVWL